MSISKNVGGMSNYLGKIRTDTNYTELKQDVENALEKLPHFGNRLTERIRGVKDLIKRILFRECCLRIWESLILVLLMAMI